MTPSLWKKKAPGSIQSVRAPFVYVEVQFLREQHNPPAIQRDRGATSDSEFLPNCVPLTFYGFLTRPKSIAWEKDLCCAVTTRTSCDTFGSVVRDISLEVCRVQSHFSELCWGTCCVGDFFLLVGSSTRWVPPRFDTRDKDFVGYRLVHRTHLILSGYIVQYRWGNVNRFCEKTYKILRERFWTEI